MTTENATPARSTEIETEICSRCGGSGQYSYCQQYGTTCFRCGGAKKTMTKRGAVANSYLIALRSKPASEIKVGDVVKVTRVVCGSLVVQKGGFSTVLAVRTDDKGRVEIDTALCNFGNYDPATLFRVRQSPEDAARTLAEALAYQDTLTATGTVRKRPRKS